METVCRSHLEFAALRTDEEFLMLTRCKSEKRAEHIGYDIRDLEPLGGAVHGLQGPTHVQVRRCRAALPDGMLDRIKLLYSFQYSIPWHLEERHSAGCLLGAADSFIEPFYSVAMCQTKTNLLCVIVNFPHFGAARREGQR